MRFRLGVLVGTALGLALALALIARVGVRSTFAAVGSVGAVGFLLFCLASLGVLSLLSLAWRTVAPGAGTGARPVFLWGRIVREAASELLPFSQLGGLLVGAQVVTALGVPEALTVAATVVDLTAEMVAQVIYMLVGLAGLSLRLMGDGRALLWGAAAAVAAGVGVLVGFYVWQQRRGVSAVGWLAERWFPGGQARAEAVTAELGRIYARRPRLALASGLHLAGWFGGAWLSWLAVRFMGTAAPFWGFVVIESLMSAVRSFGFVVPGGVGLQEGAYLVLGPLFGLPPEQALALSLLKRARDLVLGVPALLAWQVVEARTLLRRRAA